jgi:hypothetical protein
MLKRSRKEPHDYNVNATRIVAIDTARNYLSQPNSLSRESPKRTLTP